jgi:Protein of unknown function (DUF1778)
MWSDRAMRVNAHKRLKRRVERKRFSLRLGRRRNWLLAPQSVVVLSNADRDAFLAMLENPPPPNEALRRAHEEYLKRVVPGALRRSQ